MPRSEEFGWVMIPGGSEQISKRMTSRELENEIADCLMFHFGFMSMDSQLDPEDIWQWNVSTRSGDGGMPLDEYILDLAEARLLQEHRRSVN